MVRRNIIGACITTALLLVAGVTAAATDLTDAITGGGKAAGGAAGSYDVDASGAYGVAGETFADATDKVGDTYDQADEILGTTRPSMPTACPSADFTTPELPLDGINTLDVEHADTVQKTMQADTGLVTANADVSAWGHVKGWFQGITDAIGGLFNQAQVEKPDTCKVVADIGAHADSTLSLVDEARSDLDGLARTDAQLPELAPRLSGDYALEHASEVSGDVTGLVSFP